MRRSIGSTRSWGFHSGSAIIRSPESEGAAAISYARKKVGYMLSAWRPLWESRFLTVYFHQKKESIAMQRQLTHRLFLAMLVLLPACAMISCSGGSKSAEHRESDDNALEPRSATVAGRPRLEQDGPHEQAPPPLVDESNRPQQPVPAPTANAVGR